MARDPKFWLLLVVAALLAGLMFGVGSSLMGGAQ